jgi:hypothetical protein
MSNDTDDSSYDPEVLKDGTILWKVGNKPSPTPAELPSSFEKKWEETGLEKEARDLTVEWFKEPVFSVEMQLLELGKKAYSLGAQEALQRVDSEVLVPLTDNSALPLTENLTRNHYRSLLARLRKEYKVK